MSRSVVILFVRMWVEMYTPTSTAKKALSSSSWGCELKCSNKQHACKSFKSSSSWGCELKCYYKLPVEYSELSSSSWGCELKYWRYHTCNRGIKSSSSWGCELKLLWRWENRKFAWSHPLREDVSWNNIISTPSLCKNVILFVRMWVEIIIDAFAGGGGASSSSWGCELKLNTHNT